jgi:hypothetical protein
MTNHTNSVNNSKLPSTTILKTLSSPDLTIHQMKQKQNSLQIKIELWLMSPPKVIRGPFYIVRDSWMQSLGHSDRQKPGAWSSTKIM